MLYVTTAEEMRRLDEVTIHDVGIPGVVLMENAGRGVSDEIICALDWPEGSRVAILAGAGTWSWRKPCKPA